MLASSYHARQEAFVSGHGGSTMLEIFCVIIAFPLSVCVYRLVEALLCMTAPLFFAGQPSAPRVRGASLPRWPGLVATFGLCVVPLIWSVTTQDPAVSVATVGRLAAAVVCFLYPVLWWAGSAKQPCLPPPPSPRAPFLTYFRCGVVMGTCVSILAVDFHAFPRRFAKTEVYGTGLMDVGVGAFIVSGAIVGPLAREGQRGGSHGGSGSRRPGFLGLLRRQAAPIVLGMLRFAVVKAVGYQEHVSEYGVHWNFFFTLSSVAVVAWAVGRAHDVYASTGTNVSVSVSVNVVNGHGGGGSERATSGRAGGALLLLLRPGVHRTCLVLGGLLLAAYQYALTTGGLSTYIIRSPRDRDSLLSSNREGIFSTCGYASLNLLTVGLLVPLLPRRTDGGKAAIGGRGSLKGRWGWHGGLRPGALVVMFTLALATVVLWVGTLMLDRYVEPVSRRLANASYVM